MQNLTTATINVHVQTMSLQASDASNNFKFPFNEFANELANKICEFVNDMNVKSVSFM